MDEQGEIPQKEQVVMSPELAERIDRARTEVAAQGQDPQAVAGRNIAEMGFMKALWETAKPHTKKLSEIQFKQIKAQASAVISLVPFVGEGKSFLGIKGFKEGIRAGKEAKVAGKGAFGVVKEGWKAKHVFEAAEANARLAKLAVNNPFIAAEIKAGKRIDALAQMTQDTPKLEGVGLIGKIKLGNEMRKAAKVVKKEEIGKAYRAVRIATGSKGLEANARAFSLHRGTKAVEFMQTFQGREAAKGLFNLTPDVPHWLSLSTAVAELVGFHGIDVVPAVIQMGKNTIDQASTYGKLTKDVWNLAVTRLTGKGKDVARAAAAFEPKTPIAA